MNYLEIQSSPLLRRYVECFWFLETKDKPATLSRERILPDDCTELIFNLADLFNRHHLDGTIENQPRMLVVGQMRNYVMIEPTGMVKLFGIRFRAGGAYPFFHLPMFELTDRIISADAIFNRLGKELEERIHGARSLRERLSVMEATLLKRLDEKYDLDKTVEALVRRITFTKGCYSVDRLAKDIGLSARQLERKFRLMVGISPKLFSRIIRFQEVFKVVGQLTQGWSAIAHDCGYYDQAHLIHDFKNFSGQNPSAFFINPHEISDHFTRKI